MQSFLATKYPNVVQRVCAVRMIGAGNAQRTILFEPPLEDVLGFKLVNTHSKGFTPDTIHVELDALELASGRGNMWVLPNGTNFDRAYERPLLGVIYNNNRSNLDSAIMELHKPMTFDKIVLTLRDELGDVIVLGGGQEAHVLFHYFKLV